MATGVTPAVARRRLRLILREAREDAELTQSQVAEAMEWSLSKVIRIESGEVTISPNDLRPLLAYLGITNKAKIEALVQDARVSRARKHEMWYDEPRLREHLTLPLRHLIEYEAEATRFREFCTFVVPGFLQTADYASAVLGKYRDQIPEARIAALLEVRQHRRRDFLARRDKPRVELLVDESVLLRQIGGAQVLRDQLSELLGHAKTGRLVVRVMPFSLDAPPPTFGTFEILNLGKADTSDAIMYRESYLSDEIVEDKVKIGEHAELFERLWGKSEDEETSLGYIVGRIEKLRP